MVRSLPLRRDDEADATGNSERAAEVESGMCREDYWLSSTTRVMESDESPQQPARDHFRSLEKKTQPSFCSHTHYGDGRENGLVWRLRELDRGETALEASN
jgi:hypothetical protein